MPRLRALRILGIGAVVIALASCEAPLPSTSPKPIAVATPTADPGPKPGGTIFVLTQSEGWGDVDPQRVYTPEDLAFFGATTTRSLVSYAYAEDPIEGTTLIPDLATDIGMPTDGGRTWTFTLREGLTWEDGSPLVCADVAYGVSRAFAVDIMGGGPAYAIQHLDIATRNEGESRYPGPYTATAEQQAYFDEAVDCDGDTITFRLNKPVADFNYATSLGMSPVPNPVDHPDLVDPGEGYGVTSHLWSSGPYRVDSYRQGPGGSMVLVRNERWNAASDPIRPAFPESWEIHFGVDPFQIDERLINAQGDDRFALQYGQIQPQNLPVVFADADTANADFLGRAVSGFDRYTRYYWVNVEKISNETIRQALGVALDREAILNIFSEYYGGSAYGALYGDLADGVVKPNIGLDYAATGYYENLFGFPIPPQGDPQAAARLIAASGEDPPTLKWNYADTPIGQQHFGVVRRSLEAAGFIIEPGPIGPDCGFGPCDPFSQNSGDFGHGGWGHDWPNASTVIGPLFTEDGGWDLSRVDDPDFEAGVQDALATLDRAQQAAKWQALNRAAVERGWVIPTFFGRSQVLAGTKVGPIYRWPAYSSWPYGVMFVEE
jgi:peptide/nickel transport system substrate-binding protein